MQILSFSICSTSFILCFRINYVWFHILCFISNISRKNEIISLKFWKQKYFSVCPWDFSCGSLSQASIKSAALYAFYYEIDNQKFASSFIFHPNMFISNRFSYCICTYDNNNRSLQIHYSYSYHFNTKLI